MTNIAFFFPGQGAQSVGMGRELYQASTQVKELFEMAEETVKLNLRDLCFKGPMEALTRTIHLQPAITVVNLAALALLRQEGIDAHITAGHSLGEYSALFAGGVMSAADTFTAVMKRGELMHRESLKHEGAMSAIVGLPIEAVSEIVAECQSSGVVSVANHNMALQTVITGSPKAVKSASALAAAKGARCVPLNVSGAWHSELIRGAQDEFSRVLAPMDFKAPSIPVVHNVTADVEKNPPRIKERMVSQLCSPVRWYDSMQTVFNHAVDVFVEVGPGKVLSGLLKKTLPPDHPGRIFRVNNLKTLEKLLNAVQ